MKLLLLLGLMCSVLVGCGGDLSESFPPKNKPATPKSSTTASTTTTVAAPTTVALPPPTTIGLPGPGTACGPVNTEDGPLETQIVAGQIACREALGVLGGLVGSPPDSELQRVSDSEWTLREWSCQAVTATSGAIVYSCSNTSGVVVATIQVDDAALEENSEEFADGGLGSASCLEAIASADPVRMATLAINAINSDNVDSIRDCFGDDDAFQDFQRFFGDSGGWGPPTCRNTPASNDYSCSSSDGQGLAISVDIYADGAGAQINGVFSLGGGM